MVQWDAGKDFFCHFGEMGLDMGQRLEDEGALIGRGRGLLLGRALSGSKHVLKKGGLFALIKEDGRMKRLSSRGRLIEYHAASLAPPSFCLL